MKKMLLAEVLQISNKLSLQWRQVKPGSAPYQNLGEHSLVELLSCHSLIPIFKKIIQGHFFLQQFDLILVVSSAE